MTIIDCIADLHGFEPILPGGDLLILAGDYTAANKVIQWSKFFYWLDRQPYEKKILIAGNHDDLFEKSFPKNQKEAEDWEDIVDHLDVGINFEYLCDSGTEYNGLKIWGTPWTPWFHGVNPKCKAFMDSEGTIEKKFRKIPEGLDILITHGPMLHMLDQNINGNACGSRSLRDAIDRAKPKFHIFGHIHEQGNNQLMYKHTGPNTWCINCSYVDERYRPVNQSIRIVI